MFRKVIHIILSCLLLSVTIGYSISEHYCGEKVVSVEINQEAESCCDMSTQCCHTETTFFQLDEQFTITSLSHNPLVIELDLLFAILTLDYNYDIEHDLNTNILSGESPPPPKIQTKLSSLQTYLC